MKNFLFVCILAAALYSCNSNTKTDNSEQTAENTTEISKEMEYQSFGAEISDKDVLTKDDMYAKYKNLKPGDTVDVKFMSKVNSVCQNKGCWMQLEMGEQEAMIKFKDYGFFMPKDIAGDEVIVRGRAFVDEMSVEDQRHFAEDAGKSQEEIAAITEPKRTLSFTADGVLLAENQ